MSEKNNLRKLIRERKKELLTASWVDNSENILGRIKNLEEFKLAKNILCYWSMSDEVNTHNFILTIANEKNVFLPVIKDDSLLIKRFEGIENLTKGDKFSIPEPAHSNIASIESIDLAIIPGVAFDISGKRMGRGKAYYDKLLKSSNAYKIGVCFNFQIVDSVPIDEHDIVMDRVLFG